MPGEWRVAPLRIDAEFVESPSVNVGVDAESHTQLAGSPVVEPLADAGHDLSLRLHFRGPQASLHAAEAAELLGSAAHQPLAIESVASRGAGFDGYYVAGSTSRSATLSQPGDGDDQERLSPSFERAGTQDSVWLAVETTPVQVDHAWGNDPTPRVAIPASAGKRLWYDSYTGAVAAVGDPLESRAAEAGALDVYDVSEGEAAVDTAGVDRGPSLLFELAYSDAAVLDPVVWDASGETYSDGYGSDYSGVASKHDSDGERRWMRVFSPDHEFGAPVLDSGLLRVYIDETEGVLSAEEWIDSAGEWTSVGLDWSAADWALFDWSLEQIAPASIRGQATFMHSTEGLFALDAALHRGSDVVQFSIPRNEDGPVPSGLETVLDPVASAETVDPQPVRELVERSEVRR